MRLFLALIITLSYLPALHADDLQEADVATTVGGDWQQNRNNDLRKVKLFLSEDVSSTDLSSQLPTAATADIPVVPNTSQ